MAESYRDKVIKKTKEEIRNFGVWQKVVYKDKPINNRKYDGFLLFKCHPLVTLKLAYAVDKNNRSVVYSTNGIVGDKILFKAAKRLIKELPEVKIYRGDVRAYVNPPHAKCLNRPWYHEDGSLSDGTAKSTWAIYE